MTRPDLDAGFRIGHWIIRPRQSVISNGTDETHLEPKVMAVLKMLAEHQGNVVTRDEFAEEVWRGRVVSDEVLSRNISLLRSHLGDDARQPRFIQTVPRVGYRFIAEVSLLGEAAQTFRRTYIAVALAVLVALAVGVVWLGTASDEPRRLSTATIAVLPFEELSGDPDNAYFSDGLTIEILETLSQVEGLSVIARRSSFQFRDHDGGVQEIGAALNAGSILEGSVRRDADRLKITATLIDAESGLQMWSRSYERQEADVFAVQHDISGAIVQQLIGSLVPEPTPSTRSIEAYNLYLRGQYQMRRRGTQQIRHGIELFQQAIALDPGFGAAHVALAEAYTVLPNYTGEAEKHYLSLAAAMLEKAGDGVPDQARADAVRAFIHFRNWEWREAEGRFRRAFDRVPNDPDMLQWRSQFLAHVGYLDQALADALRAVELDPLSPVAQHRIAIMHMYVGDVDKARTHFRIASELNLGPEANPEAGIAMLLQSGAVEEARQGLKSMQSSRGLSAAWVDPAVDAIIGTGTVEAAARAIDHAYGAGDMSTRLYVGAYVFIRDGDAAMAALWRVAERPAPFDIELLFTPIGLAVRRHSDFPRWVAEVGLVDFWQADLPDTCSLQGAGLVCH